MVQRPAYLVPLLMVACASATPTATAPARPARPVPLEVELEIRRADGLEPKAVRSLLVPALAGLHQCAPGSGGKINVEVAVVDGRIKVTVAPGDSLDPTLRECVLQALSQVDVGDIGADIPGTSRPTDRFHVARCRLLVIAPAPTDHRGANDAAAPTQEALQTMSQDPNTAAARPFVLVLGLNLDDQDASGFALDQATRIGSRIPGSHLHIVHVAALETSPEASHETAGLLRLYVADKVNALGVGGPEKVGLHVRKGDPAREIAQLATDVGADLIVMGTHKPIHLKSLFVGSTAERVMATATCPVFVAGPKPRPEPSHVIVIEPACPDCLQRRAATDGRSWWCARHSENHHLRRHHVYSYQSELPFAEPDAEVDVSGSH